MWFLPGLPDARIGLFVRLHHVVADGTAGITDVAALLGAAAEPTSAPTTLWVPAPWPTSSALVLDNLRRRASAVHRSLSTLRHPGGALLGLRAAWPAAHELLAAQPGPETSLGRLIGPDRNLGLVRSRLDLTGT